MEFRNPAVRVVACLVLTAQLAVEAKAQLVVSKTNNWDSFVDSSHTFTHAVNVGAGGVTVNSVLFDSYQTMGSLGVDSSSGDTYSLYGPDPLLFGSNMPNPANITGQSAALVPGFVWGKFGSDRFSLKLDNLTIGQPYQLNLFQVAWVDPAAPSRAVDFTANGIAYGSYDVQDGGLEPDNSRNGTVTTFNYTPNATSVVFTLEMTSDADTTPHLQAFSNQIATSGVELPPYSYPTFNDVTAATGLQDYRATAGDLHSPGGVFTDLDNDSYPDLYLIRNNGQAQEFNQLYVNKDDGNGGRTFQLQENALGAANPTNGTLTNNLGSTGAIAGDYDNDGDMDLYVTNMGSGNRLYQNQLTETGALSFLDQTATARVSALAGSQYSMTAAWADPDRDGDLDLYVGSHDKWGNPFNGERDTFYQNNGDGTFTDRTFSTPGDPLSGWVSSTGGVSGPNQTHSASNAVVFADFNNDMWPDLLVTNKSNTTEDRDMLYINQGDNENGDWQGFETATYLPEMADSFGINYADGAMGVDVDDIDNDGDMDIIISDNPFFGTNGPNDVYVNQLADTGILSFEHRHIPTGLSWGVQIEDFDNDGSVETHITNDGADNSGKSALLRFTNPSDPSDSRYLDIAPLASVDNQNGNDRGNLAADYNRDGKIDLFVVNLNNDPRYAATDMPSVLFENTTDNGNGFLTFKLIGDPASLSPEGYATTRDAIGSRVIVIADVDGDGDDETMMREVVSGNSNAASTSSLELEFGLGLASHGEVSIMWADGRTDALGQIAASQFLTIDQANLLGLPGDFNGDGTVDLGDYTVWRDNLGGTFDLSGNGDETGASAGVVDAIDYVLWKAHFGHSALIVASSNNTVPEPVTSYSAMVVAACIWRSQRRGHLADTSKL